MLDFITTFINGLNLGGIYALIALGYTMVYGIAKMLNFAHGDIIMVGGYTIMVFFSMRGASPLAVLITAIGVSYLLQSLAQMIFGPGQQMVDLGDLGTISVGSLKIKVSTIVTLLAATAIMVSLTLFVHKTKAGKAMLAVAEDRDAARLMGINVNAIITLTFAIGSALAAVAGVFYLLGSPAVYPTLGSMPGIKAFTAAVIGGIGSIPGAMVGGLLLGIIECICGAVPALSKYTIAVEFVLLIVILLVKPSGILGKKKREKV